MYDKLIFKVFAPLLPQVHFRSPDRKDAEKRRSDKLGGAARQAPRRGIWALGRKRVMGGSSFEVRKQAFKSHFVILYSYFLAGVGLMGRLERVTVTIDSDLLAAVDSHVGERGAKSRSHAIDLLLRKAIAGTQLRKAVLLAGGPKEKLLASDGREIKPLLEVGGVPVIERTVMHLKRFGIEEIIVIVGFQGERIVSRLQNGEAHGVRIRYVWESAEHPVGSAGCLRLAQSALNESFVLSYADVLYDSLDLNDFYRFHRATNGACTLALANVDKPSSFGVAQMEGSRILDFTEKPPAAMSHLINAGIAVCEPSILAFLPRKTPCSFEHDLLPEISRKGKLFGYVYSGPWFDVGKPQGLSQAQKYFERK